MSKPTINDVAKYAGVSVGTVDRVLHRRGRVSQKSIDLVNDAIQALHYLPSPIASALASQKNILQIGITFPIIETDFASQISRGIAAAKDSLAAFGVKLIVSTTNDHKIENQMRVIDEMVKMDVDGLLIMPVCENCPQQYAEHIPADLPFATVIDDLADSKRIFHTGPDNFCIGELGAKLLQLYTANNGITAIMMPDANYSSTLARISGFLGKIRQDSMNIQVVQTIPFFEKPLPTSSGYPDMVYDAAQKCLKDFPNLNSIYITNGHTSYAAQAIEDAGKANQVCVIGHEHAARNLEFIEKGIIKATVFQWPEKQWHTAIMTMYDYLVNKTSLPKNHIFADCSIITKESLPLLNL